jgi:hypothetical protein
MSPTHFTLGLLLAAASPPADPEALATRPEMHSRQEVRLKLQAIAQLRPNPDSELRQMLRDAARMLATDDETFPLQLTAPAKEADSQQAFREELISHQKNVSYKQYQFSALFDDLMLKSDERDREQASWKVHFDLVTAQMAVRVAELYEHNAQLGQLRRMTNPIDPQTAGWRLVPGKAEELDRDAVRSQLRARKHLERLVRDYPGTDLERLARQQIAAVPPPRHWQPISR